MKTLKITISLFGVFLFLTPLKTFAQDQMYVIHIDNVKPSMQVDYEKVAKEFADVCKTYNLQDFDFNAFRYDDGTYAYSNQIKNFAELDRNTITPLIEKMGKDKFEAMFERFNKCYDSHTSFTAKLMSDLSYMPNGKLNDGNFRKNHFFYVTPSNSKAVAQKLKEIKALYTKKSAKEYYVILHSGFGAPEEFYVAILAAKDQTDYEKTSNENNNLLGEEWQKKWDEFYSLMSKYETKTGKYREDLSFKAKK